MRRKTTREGLRCCSRAWRLTLACAIAVALPQAPARAAGFTTDFRLEDCTWSAWGRQNPYFNLRPGRQLVLEGKEDGAQVRLEITALRQLETITFTTARGVTLTIPTRIVEERETADGELAEVSRNFFARCIETSDIFYFGEEVDIYEGGVVVSHEGAWRAGEEGALPGLIMPASFLLGSKYFQETAPGVAEDRAENTEMGLAVAVPAGAFSACVAIEETSALSPNSKGVKTYCPGVGLAKDGTLRLTAAGVVP